MRPELQQAIEKYAEALYDAEVAKEGPDRLQYYSEWKDVEENIKELWRLAACQRALEIAICG